MGDGGSVSEEDRVSGGLREKVTMTEGLEAADGIAGKGAERDGAHELGGVSSVDVGRVWLSEGDKGREEGAVERKDGGAGIFPMCQGASKGGWWLDTNVDSARGEGGGSVTTMRGKADGAGKRGEEERTSRGAGVAEADATETSRKSGKVEGGRWESRAVGEMGDDKGDGGVDGGNEGGLVGEDGRGEVMAVVGRSRVGWHGRRRWGGEGFLETSGEEVIEGRQDAEAEDCELGLTITEVREKGGGFGVKFGGGVSEALSGVGGRTERLAEETEAVD